MAMATLTWPREIPIEGEPADVAAIVAAYADCLVTSNVPKLFLKAEPGSILAGANLDFVRRWPAQTAVTVAGLPFRSGRFAGRHRKDHRRVDGKVG
jgi:haloalkane dehalogenase